MNSQLHDILAEFDFSGGKKHTYSNHYNILFEADTQLLDEDSADANTMVKKLGLSYDVNARHYCTVVKGEYLIDMIEIEWTFWIGKR